MMMESTNSSVTETEILLMNTKVRDPYYVSYPITHPNPIIILNVHHSKVINSINYEP